MARSSPGPRVLAPPGTCTCRKTTKQVHKLRSSRVEEGGKCLSYFTSIVTHQAWLLAPPAIPQTGPLRSGYSQGQPRVAGRHHDRRARACEAADAPPQAAALAREAMCMRACSRATSARCCQPEQEGCRCSQRHYQTRPASRRMVRQPCHRLAAARRGVRRLCRLGCHWPRHLAIACT